MHLCLSLQGKSYFQIEMFLLINFGTCNWRSWCILARCAYPTSSVFYRRHSLHKTVPQMNFDDWYISSSLVSPHLIEVAASFQTGSLMILLHHGYKYGGAGSAQSGDPAGGWGEWWASTVAGTLAFEGKSTSVCSVVSKQSQRSLYVIQL